MARVKIALGCPCALTALPVGPDGLLAATQKPAESPNSRSAHTGQNTPTASGSSSLHNARQRTVANSPSCPHT